MDDQKQTDWAEKLFNEDKNLGNEREAFMVQLRSKKKKEAFILKRVKVPDLKDTNVDIDNKILELDPWLKGATIESIQVLMEYLWKDLPQIETYELLLTFTRKCLTSMTSTKLQTFILEVMHVCPDFLDILFWFTLI